MAYRIRSTGAVVSDAEFRAMHPRTSFPQTIPEHALNAFGADPVYEGAQPVGEPWQTAQPDGVERIQGKWYTKYKLVPETMTADVLEEQKQMRLTAIAERRWQKEMGGILVGNIQVKTDETSTNKLDAAYLKATRDANFTVHWKVMTGVFVTLDAPTIIAMGDAVTAHVQACFANEKALTEAIIAAPDYDTLAAIDLDSGWPS